MSFPSAHTRLISMGTTIETATEKEARAALLYAMEHDTPEGFAALRDLSQRINNSEDNTVVTQGYDPNSEVGRQVARMMTDVCRPIIEEHFGVGFTFLNCCDISGKKGGRPTKCAHAQIRLQITPDC